MRRCSCFHFRYYYSQLVTGFYPVVSATSGTGKVHNITIVSGASLTVTGAILQVSGKITGVINATDGTLEFNGTTPQTISGTTFEKSTLNNLIISNNVSQELNIPTDTLNITGTIGFGNSVSKKTFTSAGLLTLKSTALGTASVGIVNNDNNIAGQFIVERYTNTAQNGKKWLFLSTPTKGQTVQQAWQEGKVNTNSTGYGIQISGAAGPAGGFDVQSSAPSVKFWNESKGDWEGIPNTTSTDLYNSKGYMVFVRGDRSVSGVNGAIAPNATNLRSKGNLVTGNQSVAIPGTEQFISIGNPYASAIDMTKVIQTNGSDFFYVWNPGDFGQYGYGIYETYMFNGRDYVRIFGSEISTQINNYVQSGQAFFVQGVVGRPGNVEITESSKVGTSKSTYFRMEGTSARVAQLHTTLSSLDGQNAVFADGVLQQFSEDFSNDLDGKDGKEDFSTQVRTCP